MSETILKLENINLALKLNAYRAWTLKQLFIDIAKDPVGAMLKESDRFPIAKNISFSGKAGERIGLLGLNGAGKTSLCRCIAGIYKATSGKITVNGSIRAVFNTGIGIQPELTGRENANLLSEFIFPEEANKKELVERALQFSELGDFVDVPFRLYSNGMQARLYLSLVSAKPSDVFILDEVFEGADFLFAEKIAQRMIEIMNQSGLVIFVSHSFEQIERVCNRVLILENGSIVYDGAVKEGLDFYRGISKPQHA